MSTSVPDAVAPTGVTADLSLLDTIFDEARVKRNDVAVKLEGLIKDMRIDTTVPRVTEVQMQMINTYLAVLAANEAAAGRRVASKQKQVEAELGNKHSAAVAELLARVSGIGPIRIGTATEQPDAATAEARIEQAFTDHAIDPVLETELKTDPKDTEV